MPQLPDFQSDFHLSQGWEEVCFCAELTLRSAVDAWFQPQPEAGLQVKLLNIMTGQCEAVLSQGSLEGECQVELVECNQQVIAKLCFYGDQLPQRQAFINQVTGSLNWLSQIQTRLISAHVFTEAPVIMYQAAEIDGRWILTDANHALAEFLGVETRELIGARAKHLMVDFIHPDDIPALMNSYDLTRTSSRQLTLQYRLKNAAGDYMPVTERVAYSPDQRHRRCVSVIWHREIDQIASGQQFELFKKIEEISQDLSFQSGEQFITRFCQRLSAMAELDSIVLLAHTKGPWWQAYGALHNDQPLALFHVAMPQTVAVADVSWNEQVTAHESDPLLFYGHAFESVIPLRHDDESTQAVLLLGSDSPLHSQDVITQMVRLLGRRLLREIAQIRIADAQTEQNRMLLRQKHQLTRMVSLLGKLDMVSDEHEFLLTTEQHLSEAFDIKRLDWHCWSSGDWREIQALKNSRNNNWIDQSRIVSHKKSLKYLELCRRTGELTYCREQLKVYWPVGYSAAGYLVCVLHYRDELPDEELIHFSQNALSLAQQGMIQRENLRYQAMRDSLTGLGNRVQLHAWIKEKLPCVEEASLLLFDLNRFKEINDSFGHQFGDKLLQEIGPRIGRYLLGKEHYLCRLGGDEFALFLPNQTSKVTHDIGRQLHKHLAESYIIDGLRFQVEASVGVAHFPQHGRDGHELLRCSDVAMYAAKNSNRDIVEFNADLDNTTPLRIAVLSGLDEALLDEQMWVAYQPLMSTQTGQVAGFEALIRWTHPEFGPMSPDQFIPIAEMGEGIRKITQFVLQRTMESLIQWRTQMPSLHVAVNVSPRVLLDHQFPITLGQMLAHYQLPGEAIILELTESTLLVDPIRAVEIINVLANMGINVEIDDFGTGYSSLAYLKSLPISALKIDRSFVTDILSDSQNEVIVSSTVQMAHNLGLLIVAEGVEDEATLLKMMRLGCDMIQGYYFAKPIAGDKVSDWLKRNL